MKIEPNAVANSKARHLALDVRSRGLLRRFCRDWIAPRWRELVFALMLTAVLAAAKPLLEKTSRAASSICSFRWRPMTSFRSSLVGIKSSLAVCNE